MLYLVLGIYNLRPRYVLGVCNWDPRPTLGMCNLDLRPALGINNRDPGLVLPVKALWCVLLLYAHLLSTFVES